MAKVSIIIPVYNTGKYLHKCIDSILHQTYQDLEIIIVDDGSNEETAIICDDIASCDERIKLFHKNNEGVSIARNTGLNLSTGKYIGFVDSDDWINLDMIENLVKEMEFYNADIVMCDATTIWDNGKREKDTFRCLSNSCVLDKSEITPIYLLEQAGACWRALYKARLIFDYSVSFPGGLKFSEDRIFNMIALGNCTKFRYVKKSFYNRYMRKDSCVMSYHSDYTDIALRVNELMNEILRKYWDESYIPYFEKRNLQGIAHNIISVFNLDDTDYKKQYKIVQEICSNNELRSLIDSNERTLVLRLIRQKYIFVLYLFSLLENMMNALRLIIKGDWSYKCC